jgi:two-component sensor histidine kinase
VKLHSKKIRWKIILSIVGILIVAASLFYTNLLVNQFAQTERNNVQLWAKAVHRRISLVNYTDKLFKQLRESEHQRVKLLADVYRRFFNSDDTHNLDFYLKIIHQNNSIPVIITDRSGRITASRNLYHHEDTIKYMRGNLKESFSVYPPMTIPYLNYKLYYKNSRFYNQLNSVLNGYVSTFLSEVTTNAASVPVIITDSTQQNITQFGNLSDIRMSNPNYAQKILREMKSEHDPIEIDFSDHEKAYIFYKNSELLTKMKWFPLVQILAIIFFVFIAYLLFSSSRRSEQNRVWVGMAKETAHQIGTPLSSILAWVELMKMEPDNLDRATEEITKDVKRLEIITERFSKIGSTPDLNEENLTRIILETIDYLKLRTPKKVQYQLQFPDKKEILLPINAALFSWVLENLCKNAIDAMNGKGIITIQMTEESKHVVVDVSDTGKGVPKTEQKTIFNPVYTSKKRGWGLGLSLAKRIIHEYHRGKIFVKHSSPKGTTFRIILKKEI